jgi:UDP-3-O-[3-hydroxymyristoyl] N-acetylglucosamine deacetylase/3-hydroxyacyl-[acyl-carrier-protein] dehydratase
MPKQLSLKKPFSVSGKGLHTGLQLTATFLPAEANTGIRFRRIDLEGKPEIRALAEFVEHTERGTVLVYNKVSISTVEHAVSALYAAGIDNCIIEVNGPEIPILDGSAIHFVEGIEKSGVEKLEAEKDFYIVHSKVEVSDPETGASLIILPYDSFSITTLISYDSCILSNQYARLNRMEDFGKHIAASRTFVFVREVEQLLKHNLIKGGDLDNALVIYDQEVSQEELDRIADVMNIPHKIVNKLGYINNKPVLYDNEPARHKLLDLVGDIALIGKPIKGHIIAMRPGHKINNQLARLIRKDIIRQEVQAPLIDHRKPALMDTKQIRNLLPHRWPFQMVDKVIEITDSYIIGIKNLTANESFFHGHFPDEPVMPGVLQLEAMAQTGGLFLMNQTKNPEKYITYLVKIEYVRFRKKVVPGDTLVFKVYHIPPISHGMAKMKGYAFVGNELVTEAEMTAMLTKRKRVPVDNE